MYLATMSTAMFLVYVLDCFKFTNRRVTMLEKKVSAALNLELIVVPNRSSGFEHHCPTTSLRPW